MDSTSPSKTPFLTGGGVGNSVDDGPSSPFHAMEDGGEGGGGMLVKSNPSDFSLPTTDINDNNHEGEAGQGILMVRVSDSSKDDEEQINAFYDDDNSTNSTLKVFQGSAEFEYDDIKRGKYTIAII